MSFGRVMVDFTTNHHVALFMTALGGGGAERVMLTLAEGLVSRGIRVDLVVTNARGVLGKDIPSNVRLVDLGAKRIKLSLVPLILYLRREKPNAMISAMAPTNCISILARKIARFPIRLVVVEHSTLTKWAECSVKIRDRILPSLMHVFYPFADHVVAVSSGVADDLANAIGISREKIQVIYNPVVTSKMMAKVYEPISHPWFKEGEPPVVLGVGRLIPAKDFSTLVRAFARLRMHQSVRLMIIGDGENRIEIETLVEKLGLEDSVALPGFVDNPYRYMHSAALFVLSSRWEGLPTALIEAMACGTPVVSTDCPSGPNEILENGKWGKLTPVGDDLALFIAMRQSINMDKNLAKSRSLFFSEQKAVDSYMEMLFG